ncbi:phytoene synthase [Jannaschia pagri]|uniref:Phytoene synthase n=1 Tax=Jannaschia pagri TaxID=2829797 RepID=A0ABQ4NNI8_9RHOB|nr:MULTISPECIES: squalene/phytoene synthase family protein [unclassified Jannaschia]GIT92129.1 phytoene synthase [Jannaschia sp. AI_61]GIT95964.1 phytoene synthase [Jannaschia sp. AI_62]
MSTTDIAACAGLVQRGDPDRFRAAMAAPVEARAKLFPLYAFNLEVARAPWVTQEPLIAEMRLQWWRDALDEIASGGAVRRHEVVTPLAEAIDAEGARALDGLVSARRADIEKSAPASRAALRTYLEATAGTLLWVAGRAIGAPHDGLRAAGLAQGTAAFLRAVPDLIAKGHHALPHGDQVTEMLHLAEIGLDALATARRAKLSKGARPVLGVMANVDATLRAVRKDPRAALDAPVPISRASAPLRTGLAVTLGRF